jgi:AraC-like DNA-binding protein
LASYAAWQVAPTGTTMWRVLSQEPELHVAPDGVMDLMWFQDRLVVAGADTRAMIFETRPGEVTWGLQFAPGVAHALLGRPVHELTDQRIELSELVTLPRNLKCSFEEDAPSALKQVFTALWARADPDGSTLRLAASLDRAARNGLSVRETSALHDLSERSLRRLSHTLFGYGPKTLMQIHRFQRALHLARGGMPLSDTAATAGYADQAHFTRESKRLTGQTPSQLARTA